MTVHDFDSRNEGWIFTIIGAIAGIGLSVLFLPFPIGGCIFVGFIIGTIVGSFIGAAIESFF